MGRKAIAVAGVTAVVLVANVWCSPKRGMVPCTDANVQLIEPSNYDQSCSVDSDCVAVAAGNACFPCLVECRVGGAINQNALPSYESDISKTTGAEEPTVLPCGCPVGFVPCCRGGVCHADLQCENPDAAAE